MTGQSENNRSIAVQEVLSRHAAEKAALHYRQQLEAAHQEAQRLSERVRWLAPTAVTGWALFGVTVYVMTLAR